MIEQTYPSGRKVKNTLDADGNLAQVQSQKSSTDIWRQYANNFVYTAAGAVASMKLGNGKFETTAFNSRLQPTQIGLGSSATNQGLLKLNYDYGTTNNNGNIISQTITVSTVGQATGFVATQVYSYDSLNRLKQATENITPNGGSQTPSWQQTYTFDRYGNRNFDEGNTTTLPKNCGTPPNQTVCPADVPIVNPSVNTANNRLNGYTFDASGNTTIDAEGRQFTYDAENKQVKVKDSQNQTIGEYSYDGDAKRVKKYVPATGETTIFVYDLEGKMVAEYSTQIEQSPKVSYLTHDHLGSPRILTDQYGAIISRRDFRPYGEEIARSGYGQDSIREKFATYERDEETDLDFAQARVYSAGLGRFYSVDPENAGARAFNPQTWNGFVYSINNPLAIVDEDGRSGTCRANGRVVSCAEWLRKFQAGEFETATVTVGGTSIIVKKSDYYDEVTDSDPLKSTVQFNNTGFRSAISTALRALESVGAILATPDGGYEFPGGGFGGFGGGGDFDGGGAGGNCTNCPAFRDDPYHPDNVKGRSQERRSQRRQLGTEPTPVTNPHSFEHFNSRGERAFRNRKTGEIWVQDRLHKDEFEVYKNSKRYEQGRRDRSVYEDGRPTGKKVN